MNKLKKTILALTFLGRVNKDHSPVSHNGSPEAQGFASQSSQQRTMNYDQITNGETFSQEKPGVLSSTFSSKTNKITVSNEKFRGNIGENIGENFGDIIEEIIEENLREKENIEEDFNEKNEENRLSLENFEKEVNLTENDSHYFKTESDFDESPDPDAEKPKDQENPSLFSITEVDELEKDDKNPCKNEKIEKTPLKSFHQTDFFPDFPCEKPLEKSPLENNSNSFENLAESRIGEFGCKTLQNLRYDERFINDQLVLFPDDFFKRFWNILMSFLISYVCLIMPYRVCFIDDDTQFKELDYFTDTCFYCDIFVNFFSVYHDINEEIVVSHRKIIRNYLFGWFFFDFIAIFPFDAILLNDKYNTLIRFTRLPKLYRLVRVTKLIRMMRIFKEKRRILQPLLTMGAGSQRLILSIISIVIFCHIACCFWYLTAILDDSDNNWIVYHGYRDKENFECYIAAFYWVTSTVVTVGYGDIVARNTVERLMACALMFVGVVFYSFTIGSLSSLLSEFDAKNSIFDEKLNTLLQIKKKFAFDENLYLRIKKAMKYGHLKSDQDKDNFLIELPSNLRTELSFFMHKSIVKHIEFFKNRSERFIAFIGPMLKPIKIGENEIVASQGDYANEMFFIKHGKVAIVIKQFNNFKFMNIEEGYYFGEVDLLFGETRKFTFIAETDLELLSISKKQFTKIFFHEFISIGNELYKNSLKRRIRNNKLYKEALEYCEKKKKEAKNRKIMKKNSLKQDSFVINEEKYSRKISVSKEEIAIFGLNDSIREKNQGFYEENEEEFMQSFKKNKNSKNYINKNIDFSNKITDFKGISDFSTDLTEEKEKKVEKSHKLKGIINGLIQNKRTLKDEVDDLITSKSKGKTNKNQENEGIRKAIVKIEGLNRNFIDLFKKMKKSKEKLGKNMKFKGKTENFNDKNNEVFHDKNHDIFLNNRVFKKIDLLLLNEEKLTKKPFFEIFTKRNIVNSPLKKKDSIKLIIPITTTLDKIIENEKLMINSNRNHMPLLRRKSTTPDRFFMKSITKLSPGKKDGDIFNFNENTQENRRKGRKL